MKKTYLLVSIVFLLMLLPISGAFALNKKPKLNIKKAKTTFSTNIPSSYSSASVRGEEKTAETKEEYDNLFKQVYITPKLPKVFNAKPLFEWKKPDCSGVSSCTITIKEALGEFVIHEIPDVKENFYKLDTEKIGLDPGNEYLFTVISKNEPDKLDFPIKFFILSSQEKQDLNTKFNDLKDTQKSFSELDFYVDEGLWFDLIDNLNKAIVKNPDNKALIDYKNDLYHLSE